METEKEGENIRAEILGRVRKYFEVVHKPKLYKKFEPGIDKVMYAGRVYDDKEMVAAVDNLLDFWLTLGPAGRKFKREFANYLGVKYTQVVNSGSSANLIAMATLRSHHLEEKVRNDSRERLKPGDEVITVAASFPTTVSAVTINKLIPVFIDIELGTYNMDVSLLEDAYVSGKTGAIIAAHTLGNPFDLDAVMSFAKEHNLYVVEDNCDALGAKWRGKFTGTYGDMGTFSFFPAHQITSGEGGAVCTDNSRMYRALQSSWGRHCWCEPGESNTCGKQFDWEFEGLPRGYDHKNSYTEEGFNLKPIDVQPAILSEQLKKLPDFVKARQKNFKMLDDAFRAYEDSFILPEVLPQAEPSWFGYVFSLKQEVKFDRRDVVRHFTEAKVDIKPLFAGNITRHPGYREQPHRIVGDLKNSDYSMLNTLWIGVYPGLDEERIGYMINTLNKFMAR